MKSSPYLNQNKKAWMTTAGREPLAGNRVLAAAPGSREPLIASNGELNASSRSELAMQIATLMEQHSKGTIARHHDPVAQANLVTARNQVLHQALHDHDGAAMQTLGEIIGDEIMLSLNREGFTRKFLLMQQLKQGEIGRFRVRKKDVTAWMVTQNSNVVASQVRQDWVFPPDFYLIGQILIEDLEIQSSTGDLLQEKLDDGLEQVMVAEDRVFINLVNHAAQTENDLFLFTTLTPAVWSAMRTQIVSWNLNVAYALMSADLWNDITTSQGFGDWYDPVDMLAAA